MCVDDKRLEQCTETMPAYSAGEFVSVCCSPMKTHGHTQPLSDYVIFRQKELKGGERERSDKKRCADTAHLIREGWMPTYDAAQLSFGQTLPQTLQGLGCPTNTNTSLNFYAMDSRRYPMFVHSLLGTRHSHLGTLPSTLTSIAFIVDVKVDLICVTFCCAPIASCVYCILYEINLLEQN